MELTIKLSCNSKLLNRAIGPNVTTNIGLYPILRQWYVEEGQTIRTGDPVFQVKAGHPKIDYGGPDILSPVAGRITKLIIREECDDLCEGSALFVIDTEEHISRKSAGIMLKDVYSEIEKNKFSWLLYRNKGKIILATMMIGLLLVYLNE